MSPVQIEPQEKPIQGAGAALLQQLKGRGKKPEGSCLDKLFLALTMVDLPCFNPMAEFHGENDESLVGLSSQIPTQIHSLIFPFFWGERGIMRIPMKFDHK